MGPPKSSRCPGQPDDPWAGGASRALPSSALCTRGVSHGPRPTLIVQHAHGAVTLVAGHSSSEGTVHRYLKIVGSQAVAVSVRIGKKAALQL